MISNQVLQKCLDDLRSITDTDMVLFDMDGREGAKTVRNIAPEPKKIADFTASDKDFKQIPDFQLFKVKDEGRPVYILAVKAEKGSDPAIGAVVRYHIERLIDENKNKVDKESFIKSLLLDNMLLVDIFERSKKLGIDIEAKRVVYVIRMGEKNQDDAMPAVRNLFDEFQDFVTALDKKTIIAVKQIGEGDVSAEAFAQKILKSIKDQTNDAVRVAVGTVVDDLKEVSRSYKEANMALEVGHIFFKDREINSYESLGIGRLIYQLPIPLCRIFIGEIFKNISPRDLDNETIETIDKFFENSLNVSETSRQLFIHRNTLVYRLDKIQKLTGLDLRVLDDAITFKIALMVSRYMQYVEETEI